MAKYKFDAVNNPYAFNENSSIDMNSIYDQIAPSHMKDPALTTQADAAYLAKQSMEAPSTTTPAKDYSSMAPALAQQAMAEKSGAGKLGGGLMSAGAMSGSVPLMATGAGISAIGAIQDDKERKSTEALNSRNDRRAAIMKALGGFRGAVA